MLLLIFQYPLPLLVSLISKKKLQFYDWTWDCGIYLGQAVSTCRINILNVCNVLNTQFLVFVMLLSIYLLNLYVGNAKNFECPTFIVDCNGLLCIAIVEVTFQDLKFLYRRLCGQWWILKGANRATAPSPLSLMGPPHVVNILYNTVFWTYFQHNKTTMLI